MEVRCRHKAQIFAQIRMDFWCKSHPRKHVSKPLLSKDFDYSIYTTDQQNDIIFQPNSFANNTRIGSSPNVNLFLFKSIVLHSKNSCVVQIRHNSRTCSQYKNVQLQASYNHRSVPNSFARKSFGENHFFYPSE